MSERNRPVYCTNCGSIVQPGDNFCGVCGARVTSEAQDAAPSEEIPTQVYPPPNVPARRTTKALAVVLGIGALVIAVLTVGAIVGFNLLGSETAERGGGDPAKRRNLHRRSLRSAGHLPRLRIPPLPGNQECAYSFGTVRCSG